MSFPGPPVVLEAPSAARHRLRLRFTWRGDRFEQCIERVHGDHILPLLISLEGAPDNDVIPSPPLQQLRVEDQADGMRVALLVGMAGKNHWSLSVTAMPEGDGLLFDAACRQGPLGQRLTSTYRLAEERVHSTTLAPTCYRDEQQGWELTAMPAGDQSCADLLLGERQLTIVASSSTLRTARWAYRVGIIAG